MTGPEHYRAAEVLLGNLRDEMAGKSGIPLRTPDQQAQMIAEAQVHATLALAAASAYPAVVAYDGGEGNDSREWARVTS